MPRHWHTVLLIPKLPRVPVSGREKCQPDEYDKYDELPVPGVCKERDQSVYPVLHIATQAAGGIMWREKGREDIRTVNM
jgi:hypothetical protein